MSTISSFNSAANKWLKIGLSFVKLAFILCIVFLPKDTHGGVFSYISNLAKGKEADAREMTRGSEVFGVLEAQVGPASVSAVGGGEIAIVDGSALVQEVGVVGTQADIVEAKSTQISLYVVRQGDSLSQIAKMYDVSVNTIVWANSLKSPIHEGDELVILPISGVVHKVAKGDTLRSIANKYRADMDDILSYNDLRANQSLAVGTVVIVPDGEIMAAPLVSSKPTASLHNAGGPVLRNYYMRPIEGGRKTQGLHGYNAVDIAAPIGTPIYAAADGVVLIAKSSGFNGGYGSYVVVSHSNGTQTLYAHMSRVAISSGEAVSKGQAIGFVGSTGKSTGPHLHFEIRGAANTF